MLGVLFGFYAPNIYLRNAAAKRAKLLQRSLPDGLDLMVICAEAGSAWDAALYSGFARTRQRIARTPEELAITAAD